MRGVAYRMLGSHADADDAVQEALLRALERGTDEVRDVGAWLTTITSRVCLNVLRERRTRNESELAEDALPAPDDAADPAQLAMRGDQAALATLAVLTTLSPAERVAFVLHDLFGVDFREIAAVVERSEPATRQLASRARRRLHDATPQLQHEALNGQRRLVSAFLAAARDGRLDDLVAMLARDAVLTSDARATKMGAPQRLDGAMAVATRFSGGAQVVTPAVLGAAIGAVWEAKNRPVMAFSFTFAGGVITSVHMTAEREQLNALEPVALSE